MPVRRVGGRGTRTRQGGGKASRATAPAIHRGSRGRHVALCVGIDAYGAPYDLFGCVNDALAWTAAFEALGFSVTTLQNAEANRSALVAALGALARDAKPGDVVAFQFAGHGTRVRDVDGDETDARDEALCTADFAAGRLLVDDDLRAVFGALAPGVNLSCFVDCCHSGTITQLVAGGPSAWSLARFIPESPDLDAGHRDFRASLGRRRSGRRGPEEIVEVLFSACQAEELAYETNGAGDFTTRATAILRAGVDGMTNAAFRDAVVASFGDRARQLPRLDCRPGSELLPFLRA